MRDLPARVFVERAEADHFSGAGLLGSPSFLSFQLLSGMGSRSSHWLELGALVLHEPPTGLPDGREDHANRQNCVDFAVWTHEIVQRNVRVHEDRVRDNKPEPVIEKLI
jgi:hypothetical protein